MKLWQRFCVRSISLLMVAIFLWQSASFSLLIFSTFLYWLFTFRNSSSRFSCSMRLAVSSFCNRQLRCVSRVISRSSYFRSCYTSSRFRVQSYARCLQSSLLSSRLESPETIIVFWLRPIQDFSNSYSYLFSLKRRSISFYNLSLLIFHLFFSLRSFSKSRSNSRYLFRHCLSRSLNSSSTFSRRSLSFSRSASRSRRSFFHLSSSSRRDSKCSFLRRAVYSCSSRISLFLSSLEAVSLESCWLRKAVLAWCSLCIASFSPANCASEACIVLASLLLLVECVVWAARSYSMVRSRSAITPRSSCRPRSNQRSQNWTRLSRSASSVSSWPRSSLRPQMSASQCAFRASMSIACRLTRRSFMLKSSSSFSRSRSQIFSLSSRTSRFSSSRSRVQSSNARRSSSCKLAISAFLTSISFLRPSSSAEKRWSWWPMFWRRWPSSALKSCSNLFRS